MNFSWRIALVALTLCGAMMSRHVQAGYDEGAEALKRKDFATAVVEFRALAKDGDAKAQRMLGIMYSTSWGVPQDYKEAAKWARLAADQGDADAQAVLGDMYAEGNGVPQDYKAALKWYRLAADQGQAIAQGNLGLMYVRGRGVEPNIVIAYALFNISANSVPSDQNKANANRALLAKAMTPKEIAAAQSLTSEISKPGNFLKALNNYAKRPTL